MGFLLMWAALCGTPTGLLSAVALDLALFCHMLSLVVEFHVLPASLQQAKKFGYDLSLFERLYKYFKKEFAGQPLVYRIS